MTSPTPLTFKVQAWADDLRLPCITNTEELGGLFAELEPYRRPLQPFQSKHLPALKRNTWFALQRPVDRSRTGLICVSPRHQCCFYVSGEAPTPKRPNPRVAVLRLRVDPQFFVGGLTVFVGTLIPTTRRLWLQDTLVWKGRPVGMEEAFTRRIQLANQWLEHFCISDERLLDGIQMEIAPWRALADLHPEGVWELQSDEEGRRSLLWITNHADPELGTPPPTPAIKPVVAATAPPLSLDGPLVAVATRGTGPDQWALAGADGVGLGRALIRSLEISAMMREVKGTTVRVEVAWNAVFKKWEIQRLTSAPSSHSSAFVCPS